MKNVMKVVGTIVGGLCVGELLISAYAGRAMIAAYQMNAIGAYPEGLDAFMKLNKKEQYDIQSDGIMEAFSYATTIYKLVIEGKIDVLKKKFKK